MFYIYLKYFLILSLTYLYTCQWCNNNQHGACNKNYVNLYWRNYTKLDKRLTFKDINPKYKKIRKTIVIGHNFYRSRVKPTSSNMLKVSWHQNSAKSAQKWARACQFLVHSNKSERIDPRYNFCGQNILVSSGIVTWKFVLKVWYSEADQFTYAGRNNLVLVGHYTQLVWATTSKVGCAVTKCYKDNKTGLNKIFYNYVCEYCPSGNILGRENTPYVSGQPCKKCPRNCVKGKLCTNSCPYVDVYGNCEELIRQNSKYTCNFLFEYCKATCICKNKRIH